MNDQQHNQQTYEAFALQYHQKRSHEESNLWNLYLDRPMMEKLIGSTTSGTRVLDLGCGSGLLSRWLKDRGLEPRGVDFSQGMISIAAEENPDIEFTVADIGATSYADASFELVVSGLVMHYVQDLGPVFAEVSRLLSTDGIFVFTIHHPVDEVTEVRWNGSGYQAEMKPYFHNRQYQWTMLKGMELLSYHHTFEEIAESLYRQGFVIERIMESRADDALRERYERFHARMNSYPSFCGFRARKVS
ncbi:class I SAM-dependent DNA methyltransferase [Desulfogranum mediterraneum]|uniref:class I SAM-dependent DNA methyltransferase n=1 Tax=Desulfogranum mediterraneum TaxID=160661 RepID=UPI00041EF551|nr:class I SAM-dependent methyltransferase [Desulfogranum mediterraneum]